MHCNTQPASHIHVISAIKAIAFMHHMINITHDLV